MRNSWAILLALLPSAAFAEWQEVKTDHFLIYANGSGADLKLMDKLPGKPSSQTPEAVEQKSS